MWLTPCMFLGHLKKTRPLLHFSSVWATSSSTLCSPHSSHMMRGSPVCLPSGYSPILSGSCGRLLRVDELARRDMAARVGEGNGGAPATKDGETRDPGSRRKKKKCGEKRTDGRRHRWLSNTRRGQNGLLPSVFERQRPVPKLAG